MILFLSIFESFNFYEFLIKFLELDFIEFLV